MPTFEVDTDQGTFELTADREPTHEEALAAISGQLQAEQAAMQPQPVADAPPPTDLATVGPGNSQPTLADQSGAALPSAQTVAATAAGVGLPIVGGAVGSLAGPAGTAVGGALGGMAGESARAYIQGEPQSGRAILTEGAVNAIPFFGGAAETVSKGIVKGAVKGAIQGAAATTTRSLIRDGELPQTSDLLLGTGIGAVIGGTYGGASGGKLRTQSVKPAPASTLPDAGV